MPDTSIESSTSALRELNNIALRSIEYFKNMTSVYKSTSSELDRLTKSIQGATKSQAQSTVNVKEFNDAMRTSGNYVKNAMEQFVKQSGIFDKLAKNIDEVKHVQLAMNTAMLSGGKVSKEVVNAYRSQQKVYVELGKVTEDAKRKIEMLAFASKSTFDKLKIGIDKIGGMGFKTWIAGTLGMTVGVESLGKALGTYNRTVFETTRISSRYGESLSDISEGIALASQKTTLSKMAFSDINKSFKEMYIGIPPTTKELSIFASELQKNVGYSAEVTAKKMQDLLTLQSRMPDVLGRVSDIMKAYSQNTGEGGRMSAALYMRMKALGLSAKEIRETMATIKPPSAATDTLLKMEKSTADLEKAKQDAQLAIAQKTETMLIGVNQATTALTNALGGLSKTTTMTVAALMGFATVIPVLSQINRALKGIQGYVGASRVLQGGGKGGMADIIAMAAGSGVATKRGIDMAAAGGESDTSSFTKIKGYRKEGEKTWREAETGRFMKSSSSLQTQNVSIVTESRNKLVDGIGGKFSKIMGGVAKGAGAVAGVAAAGYAGWEAGKAIDKGFGEIHKMFGGSGRSISDQLGAFFGRRSGFLGMKGVTNEESSQQAAQRQVGSGVRGMSSAMIASGYTMTGRGLDAKDLVKSRNIVLETVKKEGTEAQKIQALTDMYNSKLITSKEIREALLNTAKNEKDLDEKINKITGTKNSLLQRSADILMSITEETEAVTGMLENSAEKAGSLSDSLSNVVSKMAGLGLKVDMNTVNTSIDMANLKANLLAETASKKVVLSFTEMASQSKDFVGEMIKINPVNQKILDDLKQQDNTRRSINQQIISANDAIAEANREEAKVKAAGGNNAKALADIAAKREAAEKSVKSQTEALEKQEAVIVETGKKLADAGGKSMTGNIENVITFWTKQLEDLNKKQVGATGEELKKIIGYIDVATRGLADAQQAQAIAQAAVADASERSMDNARADQDSKIKLISVTKNLRNAYMDAQKAYGLGPTASVQAMKDVAAEIEKNIEAETAARIKQREQFVKDTGDVGRSFVESGFDPEELLKSGKSLTQITDIADDFGKSMGLRGKDLDNFTMKVTVLGRKQAESLTSSTQLMREHADLTKEMREGWLSANKEFIANAGVWSGIIPTMSRAVTAFGKATELYKRGGATFAAGGFGPKGAPVEGGEMAQYGLTGDNITTLQNWETMGGKTREQVLSSTDLKTLEKLYEYAKSKAIRVAEREIGERIKEVASAEKARTEGSGLVVMSTGGVNVPASVGGGTSFASAAQAGVYVARASGGETPSGYVISKQKVDQYRDIVGMLNPAIVGGGIPGKDSVPVPGVGMLMPGEAIVTGDEESYIAEMINKGQLQGMRRGGRVSRTGQVGFRDASGNVQRTGNVGFAGTGRTGQVGFAGTGRTGQVGFAGTGRTGQVGFAGTGRTGQVGFGAKSSTITSPPFNDEARRKKYIESVIKEARANKIKSDEEAKIARAKAIYNATGPHFVALKGKTVGVKFEDQAKAARAIERENRDVLEQMKKDNREQGFDEYAGIPKWMRNKSASGGRFGQNAGIQIRHMASGGEIQVPRGLVNQFAFSQLSGGGGEIKHSFDLSADAKALLNPKPNNFRSGIRMA